jgi:hypothetical protein
MKRTMNKEELDQFLGSLIKAKNELIEKKNKTALWNRVARKEINQDLYYINMDIRIAKDQRAALARI